MQPAAVDLASAEKPRSQAISESARAPTASMSIPRRVLLSAFFFMLIGGQAVDVVLKHEDWPFSSYPMYSEVRASTIRSTEFVGVGPDGEFPLTPENHFAPFDNARFQRALSLIRRGKDAAARQDAAVAALLKVYDASRKAGRHEDPPLLAIRAYDVTWDVESGAKNRERPNARDLSFYLYLPPAPLRTRLRRAAAGDLLPRESDLRRVASLDDLVVGAGAFAAARGVARVNDTDASDGFAWHFDAQAPSPRAGLPSGSARLTVVAEHRAYALWLRGAVTSENVNGSLAVSVLSGGKLVCPGRSGEMGDWRTAFPAHAFAWSGAAPGAPPCSIEASGGSLTLEIAPHHGGVLLDQVWLATAQHEAPAFAEAVAVLPARIAGK